MNQESRQEDRPKDFLADFFVFRTPLLPYEEIEAFAEGIRARGALDGDLEPTLQEDRELLRRRLLDLADRPEVREAVFLASPSLFEGLETWRADPESKKGQRAEMALVRYFYRMAARATPFGLFSGCTLGRVDPEGTGARLDLRPRSAYERHTRLDMDYLFALCEELARDPAVRQALTFRPSSSLYRAGGRIRYAEARLENKVRSHHLVAVDDNEFLEAALRRAAQGASIGEIAEALVAADPEGEVTLEEAAEFVHELIDSQLLVSDLSTPVTGPEAIHELIDRLRRIPGQEGTAERLERVRRDLEELDAGGPGGSPESYREVARTLEELPTPVEMARLFQLDMIKPGEAPTLGDDVIQEMLRGVAALHRLAGAQQQEAVERFRRELAERYADREVPLVEVLDEEIGIGFDRSGDAGAEASPLLRGIAAERAGAADNRVPWGRVQGFLLARLEQALLQGEAEIALTDQDLDRMAPPPSADEPDRNAPPPLPDAFHAMGTLAAPSEEALARGEFRLLLDGAGGPSGARLLGRFCHADPELTRHVERHLRAEEAHRPGAVFAEVVHLPQGRIGNILARPVLRDYEIPFLGLSGAPADRQIPVGDLTVRLEGSRIVLRSARLGREVVPRLTSAHNFWRGSLGLYRFLGILQSQGVAGGASWNWGPLDSAPFLPRVTYGRLVLARASWWLDKEEIEALTKGDEAERFRAVQAWRERRRLPRLVALADADNELLVDLDNALSVETLLDVVAERDRARLHEFFPGPDEMPARGPEGRFLHEILVPFVRAPRAEATAEAATQAAAEARPPATVSAAPAADSVPRSFPPGSEWLYAKLYTGTATADRVLGEVVAPLVRELVGPGRPADGWFFIRYGDPEWHLRVRFHGDPAALARDVLPRLHAAASSLLDEGRLWRVQLDTYDRETERYGGPEGIALAEKVFEADSDAVLDVLDLLEGDEGADYRWRIALRGVDMLLDDLVPDPETKGRVLYGMRESFFREFGGSKGLQFQIDRRLRDERRALMPLLDPERDTESELAPALAILRRRSERIAPHVAELRRREQAGLLNAPLAAQAGSYVHMFVNRMIRGAARAHEMVLYDFLHQLHVSRAAMLRKEKAKQEKGKKGD